jgi:protein TonB
VPSANRSPRATRPIPSRAPAQAGRILAAAPSAANLGGTTFVTGNAARYAGGTTASSGTSSSAVSGPVGGGAPTAAPLPTVVRPARKGPDKSAPVRLPDTDWTCAWPTEAEDEDIDEQSVVLEVTVKSDGTAESVRVLRDPGHGFGAAARACALATRFSPAADAEGHAVRAPSPPIRVHFTR